APEVSSGSTTGFT
ncbi:hypothetical protein D043_2059B, partial [Vibrio parahaemolyticus EKP-021]